MVRLWHYNVDMESHRRRSGINVGKYSKINWFFCDVVKECTLFVPLENNGRGAHWVLTQMNLSKNNIEVITNIKQYLDSCIIEIDSSRKCRSKLLVTLLIDTSFNRNEAFGWVYFSIVCTVAVDATALVLIKWINSLKINEIHWKITHTNVRVEIRHTRNAYGSNAAPERKL